MAVIFLYSAQYCLYAPIYVGIPFLDNFSMKHKNGTLHFRNNYQSHYEKQKWNSPFLSKVFYYILVQICTYKYSIQVLYVIENVILKLG